MAVIIQKKFPADGDLFKRIYLMLPVFYLMNAGAISGAFYLYEHTRIVKCVPQFNMLWWTVLYACMMSTVITFINEGIANWEKWKNSLAENEKLTNAYQRSRLLGLKGQINPHFLFNCFNTLSGLIHEDEEGAEKFLDEMTKVHRYLLRGDDEFLVPIIDEIKFTQSYLYLAKARFGNAIKTSVELGKEVLHKFIPPLSMQVILENIIYSNALSKKEPLTIHIEYDPENGLIITHTLHEKIIVKNLDIDEGLDNLLKKYKLLNTRAVNILDKKEERIIILPLFDKREFAL
ncbi:MAG: histidine kinase [Fimbriimonadaceae bacterium]|nr:histidine kinase [Chitinophagales bacterium]